MKLPAVEVRWTAERAQAVAGGIAGRRRRRATVRTVAAVILVAALAGGLALHRRAAPTGELVFADGSVARPLGPEARVRPTEVAAARVAVALDRGGARFSITRNPARLFSVTAGDVVVEVLGTRFTVERLDPAQVAVAVEHGRVRVRWPGGTRELTDGQSDRFPPPPPAVAPAVPVTMPAWRVAADEGDYKRAWSRLRASELRDEPGELLAAADVARLSGHPREALPPLQQILQAHAGDPRASLAAFTLGRVLLDELGRPREAAEAFADARARDPLGERGPLAADALAREVEAWAGAGEPARARARAEEYRRRYPSGARLGSVKRFGGVPR